MDLRPLMEFRVENAYYQPGASRRGLAGFLGTEVAQYEVLRSGLRLLSVQPMIGRPENDLPVQRLIAPAQMRFPYHRFYFEVLFRQKGNAHGSVLLGGDSQQELDGLSEQMENPELVCNASSTRCTIFPEACSVSIEMKIRVKGEEKVVIWGNQVASVVSGTPRYFEMKRLYGGKLRPVKIDPRDPNALRLPLLPGDEITWN
jgi:hypothetical protein